MKPPLLCGMQREGRCSVLEELLCDTNLLVELGPSSAWQMDGQKDKALQGMPLSGFVLVWFGAFSSHGLFFLHRAFCKLVPLFFDIRKLIHSCTLLQ